MGTGIRLQILRYGSAILVIALAIVLRLLLDPVLGNRFPFITLFFAVVLVAWLVGLGPSIAALILSCLSAAYFILPPRGTLWVQGADNQLGFGIFCLAGLAVAAVLVAVLLTSLSGNGATNRLTTTTIYQQGVIRPGSASVVSSSSSSSVRRNAGGASNGSSSPNSAITGELALYRVALLLMLAMPAGTFVYVIVRLDS